MKRISGTAKSSLVTFVALLAIYSATLAPDVTFWDAGEFLAAIHSLGIPHPPGTPLYVIGANVWARLFTPVLGFARAVNLFSAACAAAGCAVMANLFSRWMRDPYVGTAAAICAGATSSLWLSATETEVYAASFFVATLLLRTANELLETKQVRYALMLAYLAGLGWALHLTVLIALPAALVLVVHASREPEWDWRHAVMPIGAVLLLGASAVAFMYIRAQHDPAINQGNPSSFAALIDVIQRRQYEVVGFWPRRAPLYLQIGNMFEWADWQFALGLDTRQPPSFMRTPVTILFALLGVIGSLQHRRSHLPSWRAMLILLLVASIGVAVYLNLKAGPSYAVDLLGNSASHETRERDYFFILAWAGWGLWAGTGAVTAAQRIRSAGRTSISVGLAVAASPLIMNWKAVDRSRPPASREASAFAVRVMQSTPPGAIMLARGDNDTYPVWYLREVGKKRPDIVTVTVPMLPAPWYRQELARRYALLDSTTAGTWKGTGATIRVICERAKRQGRSVAGPYDVKTGSMPPAC